MAPEQPAALYSAKRRAELAKRAGAAVAKRRRTGAPDAAGRPAPTGVAARLGRRGGRGAVTAATGVGAAPGVFERLGARGEAPKVDCPKGKKRAGTGVRGGTGGKGRKSASVLGKAREEGERGNVGRAVEGEEGGVVEAEEAPPDGADDEPEPERRVEEVAAAAPAVAPARAPALVTPRLAARPPKVIPLAPREEDARASASLPSSVVSPESPSRAASPPRAADQHARNVALWDGLFAARYVQLAPYERVLRVYARNFLDSQGCVKPLCVEEVSRDLDGALARLERCRELFPACGSAHAFEDFVAGTEESPEAVRPAVDAAAEADAEAARAHAVVLAQERAYSARDRAAAILRTCVRVCDMRPLDPAIVRELVADGVADVNAAVLGRFNVLFGVAERFSPAPDASWVVNYRHLRDAYAFANFFSHDYFSREGLVSCALGQVPESDIIYAHERCVQAFPQPALCPVTLDHLSWTRLSDADFARKVFTSTTPALLARALHLDALDDGSLSDEWLARLATSTLTLEDLTRAADCLVKRDAPLRCWTSAGAVCTALMYVRAAPGAPPSIIGGGGGRGGSERDAGFRAKQAADAASAAHAALDVVEDRCAGFVPPRRFADSEEWAGLGDAAFAGRLFRTLDAGEMAGFFSVPRVGAGMHELLQKGMTPLGEAAALLEKDAEGDRAGGGGGAGEPEAAAPGRARAAVAPGAKSSGKTKSVHEKATARQHA